MHTPPPTPRRRLAPALVALGTLALAAAAVLLALHPRDPDATPRPSSEAEASGTTAPATSLAAGRRGTADAPAFQASTPPTAVSGTVWRDGRPAAARVELRASAAPRADAEAALAAPLPAPPPRAAAPTHAGGRFSATIEGTGRFEALARAADGATGFARFRVDRPGEPAVVVIHLAPAGETLRGRIRFPDGTPFVGLVATRPDARRTRWLEAPPVATDADGRFAVPGVPAGRTTVLAWRPGEITVSRRGILLPHEGEIEIVVGRQIATLRGVVVDPRTGHPIAFAAVNLDADDRADDLFRTRATAAVDGRFTILASGRHPSITVVADGYARLTLPHVDPSLPCEVSLAAHASVSGRVLRETDASPIPAARVEVLSLASRTLGEIVASATSDALGRYRIDGLPPGDFAIVGSTAEWTSPRPLDPKSGDWGPLLLTLAPGAMADRDLRLQRATAPALPDGPPAAASPSTDGGVTLEVTILDDATGAPIGGARVWALAPWSRAATTTDASGRATLTGLDRDFYNGQLGVDVPGHASARRRLESIEGSEVTVRLGPARVLSGRVVRKDGVPVPGAEVSLFDEGTADTTAADGTFRIEGAPGDAWNVCAMISDEEGCSVGMASGQGAPGTELVIVYDEAEDVIDGPPRLDPAPEGQGIVARVTDSEGRPVPSAHAALVRWDYAWPAEVRSGRVSWDGIPGDEARLQVWGARDAYGVPLPLGCASVSLPSEARTVEVRLPPPSAVTGVVLGPEGMPAPGVLVIATWPRDADWLRNDPRSTEAIGSARSDATGRFAISGPAERQEVALVVVAPTGTLAPRARARGGGGAVEVRLTRADADSKGPRATPRETTILSPSPSGLAIRGRLTLPPEATHVLVTARRDGFLARGVVSEDGRFEIVGLPPGDWSLRAVCEAHGERCEAEATVAAGDTADLFLQAPRRMYE